MCSIEVFMFGGVVPVFLSLMFISYLMCSTLVRTTIGVGWKILKYGEYKSLVLARSMIIQDALHRLSVRVLNIIE